MTFDGLDLIIKLLLAANGLAAIVLFVVARILKRKRKLTVDSEPSDDSEQFWSDQFYPGTVDSKRFVEMVVDSPEWLELEADVLESKLDW